jgi:hypothetical protein
MYSAGILVLDNEDINENSIKLLNNFAEKLPLFIVNIGDSNNKTLSKIRNEKIINLRYPYDNIYIILSDILDEYLL